MVYDPNIQRVCAKIYKETTGRKSSKTITMKVKRVSSLRGGEIGGIILLSSLYFSYKLLQMRIFIFTYDYLYIIYIYIYVYITHTI